MHDGDDELRATDPSPAEVTETLPEASPSAPADDRDEQRRVSRDTARLVSAGAARQVLSLGLLAVTSAVVARELGAAAFGAYAGGTAAYYLALSFTDLGFGSVLTREMAKAPERAAALMRSTVQVQGGWSLGLALVLFAVGALTGGTRGQVMLILSPAVAIGGLTAWRQIFAVRYRAAPLLIADVTCTAIQAGVMTSLALVHAGVLWISAALSFAVSLNVVIAVVLGRRELADRARVAARRRAILRMALPVGVASLLASLYFTIDQTILGYLVSPRQLGEYAAAVRLLSALVAVPGFVVAAAMPGLSRYADRREDLTWFAARLVHWLAAAGLPIAAGLCIFATPVIHVVFGAQYGGSAHLLRILMAAGALSLLSNVLGIILVSASVIRPMLVFNVVSLIINVAGNFVLVPRYGVTASAWLTVACEALVVTYALVALRRRVVLRRMLSGSGRSVTAVVLAAIAGLALGAHSVLAIGSAIVVFVVATVLLRAWPSELTPARGAGGRASPGR